MIKHHIYNDVLELQPSEHLTKENINELTKVVDTYLEAHEKLRGIVVYTEHFPMWESFQTMVSHFRFVKNHHDKIDKVALVTDSLAANIAPLVNHFVNADIKKFPYAELKLAHQWIEVN